jgi:hypothetical protein
MTTMGHVFFPLHLVIDPLMMQLSCSPMSPLHVNYMYHLQETNGQECSFKWVYKRNSAQNIQNWQQLTKKYSCNKLLEPRLHKYQQV